MHTTPFAKLNLSLHSGTGAVICMEEMYTCLMELTLCYELANEMSKNWRSISVLGLQMADFWDRPDLTRGRTKVD